MVQAVMAAGQATPVGHRPHPSATGHDLLEMCP
jgi:hypothetical protein